MKFKTLLTTTALLSSGLMIATNASASVKHYDDKESFTKATGQTITTLKESPFIKKYMPKLAPINVRLKDLDPLVEKPAKEIGIYGGQANILTMSPGMGQDTTGFMPFDMLLGLESDNRTIVGGFADSYKLSKDMKTMTFTLRKGLKWSDGVPVTSQELVDWHTYIIEGLKMPTDLNGFKIKAIDSRTFSITLDHPNAFMANLFADYAGSQIVKPFHYFKHFLPKFNKNILAEAKKAGYRTSEMYAKAEINSINVATGSLKSRTNIPTLSAYVLTKKANDHWTFTRNPYYWRVDTKGNQLPYVDRMQVKLMNSPEVLTAKILAGDADYSQYNNTTDRMTVFKQHEKEGHYKTYAWMFSTSTQPALSFNISYNGPDKVGLKIIQDVRFRRAFSLMIDRDKINNTLFYGRATPTQMTVHSTSQYYKKKYAQAYVQYDPKQANKLLDQMGLKWDSRHKYRLRPDGKSLTFLIPTASNGASNSLIYEMTQTFAQAVGIRLLIKELDWPTLVHNHINANVDLLQTGGATSTEDPCVWMHPRLLVPYSSNNSGDLWGMNYVKWLEAKNKHLPLVGVEPPQYIKDLYNIHMKMLASTDLAKRKIYADEILKVQADKIFTIGFVANPPKPLTARDNVINVDQSAYTGSGNKDASNYAPETRFFKRPLYKNQLIK